MRIWRFLATVLAVLALGAGTVRAEPVRTPHVEAELHAARAAIAPGETFTIALRQTIIPNWHTYWRNPGDSGEPTQVLAWSLPPGFVAGPIQWPAPQAIPAYDIIVNYGYSDEVLLPITITAPTSLRAGETAVLSGDFYWLACEQECVPEQGTLSLALPVAPVGRNDPRWAGRIAEALAGLPKRAPFEARITAGEPGLLTIGAGEPGDIRGAHFFPYDQDAIDHARPQSPKAGSGGLAFSLTAGVAQNLGQGPLAGVVAYEVREGANWRAQAYEIEAAPGEPIAAADVRAVAGQLGAPPPAGAETGPAPGAFNIPLAFVFAFLGGVILNVMPCVLPVLSIKALSLAGGAHSGAARRHGLLYMGGVVVAFLGLAGLLIALRSAGAAVGWGFQLQEPWLMAGLALLFFGIGLNLMGLFTIGGSAQGLGAGLADKGGDAGAFFTGALAVIAATPCTAPFMAGATGFALTQSAGTTLTIFLGLALGFAAPITGLAFAPALQRAIPKPGPWMDRFKQFLAFPMFGAAAWLAWVVTVQAGAAGALSLMSLAVALSFVVFVGRWSRAWLAAGLAVLVATGAMTWRPLLGAPTESAIAFEDWSPDRVDALRAQNTPVFVNFTAAWCVSCKVNERLALDSPRIARAFAEAGVVSLRADWTTRNAEIAAALDAFDRAGVPLYLYYRPGAEAPLVLPQFLTERIMMEAIGGAKP